MRLNQQIPRLAHEFLGGTLHKESEDFLLRHFQNGSATECDGLEDLPYARTIDIASRLAPGLHGKARDMLQDQASSVVALS